MELAQPEPSEKEFEQPNENQQIQNNAPVHDIEMEQFQMQPIEKEVLTVQKIEIILQFMYDLRSDPQAAVFDIPVNWRALELPDYPQIVKEPMDLQTLESKVKGHYRDDLGKLFTGYKYFEDFHHDLNLVWSNCKLFN